LNDPTWQLVLSKRPGISDLGTLVYRNEEELLASAHDPETEYRQSILPDKLALNLRYMRGRSITSDCRLIYWTLRCSLVPTDFSATRIRQLFS
jgi:lipopolysaccharide/colanic/teichoic acid biosynthesis glycosyltransferase